jgi:hypothetical protein
VPSARALDRGWFWIGVLTAVLALVAGVVIAVLGYTAGDDPDTIVLDYYGALGRADAPAALALGAIPAGPRALLTSEVLAEQQKLAPIRDVSITSSSRHGSQATVAVSYRLDFPGAAQQQTDQVTLTRRDGRWRLDRVAAATQLRLLQAADRASILGAPLPDGTALLFPGALPVSFDTPYLELPPSVAAVGIDAPSSTDLHVEVSPAGRAAVYAAVAAQLRGCLKPGADPRCPLPTDRIVPGTLRGRVDSNIPDVVNLAVAVSARGVITIDGQVLFTGTWRALSFENVAEPQRGDLKLPVEGTTYLTAPLHILWQQAVAE